LQCIVGIANSAAVLTSVGSVPNNACGVLNGGQIYLNGANASGNPTLGARANGDIIGTAADLDNKLVWFRVAPSGNWNGNAGFAPGGSGGVGFSSIGGSGVQFFPLVAETFAPAAFTANFGDAAFSGTTPAGFTAGWPTSSSGGAGTTQARAMVLA
jgi:hypothetical protein